MIKIKNKKYELQIDNIEFWDEHEMNKGGIRILWSGNIGFGSFDIVKKKDGNFIALTERMCDNEDKEFIKEIFNEFIKMIKIIE